MRSENFENLFTEDIIRAHTAMDETRQSIAVIGQQIDLNQRGTRRYVLFVAIPTPGIGQPRDGQPP